MASETSTGTLVCRHCDCVNQESRQFCASCGKRLREPCAKCGTLCLAGEKYCGTCGVDLEAATQTKVEFCESTLADVPRLVSAARYDDALKLLAVVSRSDHPELAEYAARAGELIMETTGRRDRHVAEVESACRQARQHAEALDYEAALALIEAIPPPLLGEEAAALMAEMRSRKEEVRLLSAELETANRLKKVSPALLPRVERLLELAPSHAVARQMANRMRDGLLQAASKRMASYNYDDAFQLVKRIPRAVRTAETEELYARAAELACLWWDLHNAPMVDRALLAAAKRLRELSPDDPKAAELEAELLRRKKSQPKAPQFSFPPWVAPPGRTHVEYPVQWITGFERIEVAEGVDQTPFIEHPGCFCVACGLALQGLGKAAVNINLIPKDSFNVLDRVTQVMNKRMGRKACWGIDFSSSGLKAVKLTSKGSADSVVIEACDFIEHRKILSQAINQEEEKSIAEETLATFIARNSTKGDRLCVGLAGSMAFCRHVTLPPVKHQKLDSVMRHEVQHHVPYKPKDLVWDYEVMNHGDSEAPAGQPLHLVLVAVKRPPLIAIMEQFRAAGLRVNILQCDCLALHNFIAHERFGGGEKDGESDDGNAAVAVLDVGADSTNVVVSSPGSVWFRSNRLGGISFTKALVRDLTVTFAQAEQQKQVPAETHRAHEIEDALKPVFADLAKELDVSFASLAKSSGQRDIQEILGVGGGFQLHGLLRYLRLGR